MKKVLLLLVITLLMVASCNRSNKKSKKVEYLHADSFGKAIILRDKNTKALSLDIETSDKWTLYGGTSIENIDFTNPFAEGRGSGIFSINVTDSVRYYFQLVTPKSKIILSDSHLPMSGGYNFRDLGGIKTKEGNYVKWGKLFRSDDLHNLTDKDLAYLSSIPLISIVDFRSQDEINKSTDRLPSSVIKDYTYSITPGNLLRAYNLGNMSTEQLDEEMKNMNILLVTDTLYTNQYKKFFSLLQNSKNIPLLFHCSAGKDRTGMGAALILFSLGVDENTILENYLLSNNFLENKYVEYIAKNPNLNPLFEVKREFLMSGIDRIKKDHGSVQNFLTEVLDVDINKMREVYLDK